MTNNKSKPTTSEKDVFHSILNSCSEAKGIDLVALDVKGHFDLANKFIIVSGRSDRHTQGIANRIQADLEKYKIEPISVEGFNKAHWILLDFDETIVHIFYEDTRKFYELEKLWEKADKINVEKILEVKKQKAA
mgnify:CR=1 FL=1